MKVITSPKKLQQLALKLNKSIAVVPTMGALHDGHLSLVKKAKSKASVVIVTIFVNPLQFGPGEDLAKYPKPLQSDLKKLKDLQVDYVFTPKPEQMYTPGHTTTVHLNDLTNKLCGKSRPGHFDGVTTVVLKLFNLTQADYAVFGKKDYQQFLVIQRMVQDLNLPIKIIGAPLVREKDGLALSSRNQYLNSKQRQSALKLSKSLKLTKKHIQNQPKKPTAATIRAFCQKQLSKDKQIRVDYVECLDSNTLNTIKFYQKNKTLLAIAAWVGKTRLIDNIVF